MACVIVMSCVVNSQKSAASSDESLATMQLENVKIKTQGVESFFSELSLYYNIPVGLEIAINDNEFNTYKIDFKKGALSDLLTQFVNQHNEYTWDIKDGVINIFPKDSYRDSAIYALLKTEISSFSVKERTSCWDLESALIATPEIEKVLVANGLTRNKRNFTGAYIPQLGRRFTLDVSDMMLKSILNKVIKESPTAKFWCIKRYSDNQTFFISLNAQHEDLPTHKGKLLDDFDWFY